MIEEPIDPLEQQEDPELAFLNSLTKQKKKLLR